MKLLILLFLPLLAAAQDPNMPDTSMFGVEENPSPPPFSMEDWTDKGSECHRRVLNIEAFKLAVLNAKQEIAELDTIEGRVIVKVLVNEAGKVDSSAIILSPHEAATQLVKDHLHLLEWEPCVIQGKTTRFWAVIPIKLYAL